MEKYCAEINSYLGANSPAALGISPSPSGKYTLSVQDLTSNTYTLIATPVRGSLEAKDTENDTLRLSQRRY